MTHIIKQYLDKHEISAPAFANEIGINRSSLNRYINGVRFPSRDIALRIYEASQKEIQPEELYALREGER